MKRNLVHLVGAGPGDPRLITVKGLECIKKADVIIYDYLVNIDLLKVARPDAEFIYVGKQGGAHGRLVELAPTRRLFPRPQDPYTRMLLDAVPDLSLTGKSRTAVAGEVPNPLDPPPGCAFHPRCPLANERCRTEIPRLLALAEGGEAACHAAAEGRLPARVVAAA